MKNSLLQLSNKQSVDVKVFGIDRNIFLILLFFYLLAHGGLLLLHNAIYWDDWVLFNVNSNVILEEFKMAGAIFNWVGYLHVAMLTVGPWLYKTLTFILMFFTGILLWKIIERNTWIDIETRFLTTLLFLVLPINWARVALIDFPYVLCYFSFFLAWYLVGRNRLLALAFFLFSFNIPSFLVFYSLPIAEWYFRGRNHLSLKSVLQWTFFRVDFIILPFLFWTVKNVFFKPYGAYVGYNQSFNLANLIKSPLEMSADFGSLNINVFLFFIFLVIGFFFIKQQHVFNESNHRSWFLSAGLLAFVSAVFPYWILGHVPTFFEWTSRHQLLMPLGCSILLVCLTKQISFHLRYSVLVILLASSLALNVQVYFELYKDWSKQKYLISLLAENEIIRDARVVVFEDRTENARKRIYRFYEWNGLMKLAYKDEIRFGLSPNEVKQFRQGYFDQFFTEGDNAKNFTRKLNQKTVVVKIEYDVNHASLYDRLTAMFLDFSRYKLTVSSLPSFSIY